MTLPRKKSHSIEVNGVRCRWMVTVHHGVLHLTVEHEGEPGQLLQVHFADFRGQLPL